MRAIVLLLALTFVGCSTVGREITGDQLTGFQEGKTTQDEVIAKLGTPTSKTISESNTVLVYSFMQTQVRPESFIPIVGIFVGGADVRSSSASFVFGKDGKLTHYSHRDVKTGSGTGFASGRYRAPDRSLPQEAVP